jgi:hypothetical protein
MTEEAQPTGEANSLVENTLSSVEITKNSKGYNWKVKVYNVDPIAALNTSFDIEQIIRDKYGGQT